MYNTGRAGRPVKIMYEIIEKCLRFLNQGIDIGEYLKGLALNDFCSFIIKVLV